MNLRVSYKLRFVVLSPAQAGPVHTGTHPTKASLSSFEFRFYYLVP